MTNAARLSMLVSVLSAVTSVVAAPGACDSTTGRSVGVHGTASVDLRPDRVAFTIGVQNRNPSVTTAYQNNRSRVSEVVAGLKRKGVSEAEMQTSYFDITTVSQGKGLPRTFQVESVITVTRADPSTVADLLQSALNAGANRAGDLRFFIGDPKQSQRHGLELAFEDARSKAEALAQLSKRTLGDVICMSDNTAYPDGEMVDKLRSLGYVGGNSVQAGTQQVTFNVSAVFELK